MTKPQPQGVLPVFQTPFHEDESLDFDTLAREIEWLFNNGADGIVMAMVSEVLRLSDAERRELAARVCRCAEGRGTVVISVGAESSLLAQESARHAESVGATAVMAIPPISVALDDSELRRYYERILNAISIPVIVQDASGYVGRPMSIDMQAGLFAEYGDRVMYKPEANPIGPRLTALNEATGGKAKVFEGTGGIALVESYARGIAGTMPGADLIRVLTALWRALNADDFKTINRLHPPLCSMISLQTSLDAFLAIEKYLLVKQGVFKNTVTRGPVGYRLDAATRVEVDRLYELLMAGL
nr:dihydrodipicolinate synthase family protein [Symmachiella macrocystis]